MYVCSGLCDDIFIYTAISAGSNNPSSEDKGLDATPVKDDDPDGMKLISCADPLERAMKFLSPLKTLARDKIDVWIAIYDVAVRRSKLPFPVFLVMEVAK